MVVVKLSAFAGEKPLIAARLLPETAATAASNLRLDDGALTPTRKSRPIGQNTINAAKTLFRHGTQWLSWASAVNAVPGPVAEDRLYYTGDGAPKMRVAGSVFPLALPAPASTPTATVSGVGDGDTASRTYVWTWVTDFGEESAPSPTSEIIDWRPGQTVTLTGFENAPAGRNITRQRIYRSQTGTSGTYLYFIDERAATAADYTDTVAVDDFGEALPSSGWTPPPDDMAGLISMPNGMMAAHRGREVLFSEPWRPHAWPDRYTMTCETEVVGLASIGSVLIVMTRGAPYLMSGTHPDSVVSQKLEANFACINPRGIVDLGFAVCYPAEHGLVTVAADGTVRLATEQLFSREDWLAFSPSTIVAAQHAGAYLFAYDTNDLNGSRYSGALMINVSAGDFLVRTDELMAAMWYDQNKGALYFIEPNDTNIRRFDDPDMPSATAFWKSKEFWTTRPENFGALVIDMGAAKLFSDAVIAQETSAIIASNTSLLASGSLNSELNGRAINASPLASDPLKRSGSYDAVTVTVYGDGKLVRSFKPSGGVDRLPAKAKARRWEISVSANIQITQIMMAGTVDELRGQA